MNWIALIGDIVIKLIMSFIPSKKIEIKTEHVYVNTNKSPFIPKLPE